MSPAYVTQQRGAEVAFLDLLLQRSLGQRAILQHEANLVVPERVEWVEGRNPGLIGHVRVVEQASRLVVVLQAVPVKGNSVADLLLFQEAEFIQELRVGVFACIEAVQIAVQAIGEKRCPRRGVNVEPLDFMARNHGCCYDRARFIEKALRHYGFETRHLALIQPYRGISLLDFVPLGQSSHATTEVLTSRGWLGVDSNWPLILIDDAGTTFTYRDAIASEYFRDSWVPQWFYRGELDYFYGLYSRHGFAFGIDAPGPEWAFSEVRHNF